MTIQNPLSPVTRQDSIFDLGKLVDLKHKVKQGGDRLADQKQVATQFEALFLQMMLKRMREATPRSGLFNSEQTRMLEAMGDEQLALQLATPGIGLAQALLKQMQQSQGGSDVPDTTLPGIVVEMNNSPTVGSRKVSALLNVLRSNRPLDRALAASEGAPDHVVAFVSRMSRAAHVASQQSGVPARLILGQAALESGWGRREIKGEDGSATYNLFGIKAGSNWKGKAVNVMTTEYENGIPRKVVQPFRAYSSYEEAFADYARLLGDSPRYERVANASTEIEAARKIQQAGYATDPRYAEKLIGIMSQLRPQSGGAAASGGL
jgi:flagellar protein FlgJ